MIEINKVDEKNITFNGKTCAAAYKADAGRDGIGEFVLISEITGERKMKIRIGELSVNGVAYGDNDSADAAAYLLNQFIGNFRKGGDGGKVQTVNDKAPDGSGNIQLTASDVGAIASDRLDKLAYKRLRAGTATGTNGWLVKLRTGTTTDGNVISIIGFSGGSQRPINTTIQLTATQKTGAHPTYSGVNGVSYGYALQNLRIFAMAEGSSTYSTYLWIPITNALAFLGIKVYDSADGIGSSMVNVISNMAIENRLPADSERFGEVRFTPYSVLSEAVGGSWLPSLPLIDPSSYTVEGATFLKRDNLVFCRARVTFHADCTEAVGAVTVDGLPFQGATDADQTVGVYTEGLVNVAEQCLGYKGVIRVGSYGVELLADLVRYEMQIAEPLLFHHIKGGSGIGFSMHYVTNS